LRGNYEVIVRTQSSIKMLAHSIFTIFSGLPRSFHSRSSDDLVSTQATLTRE
jgi:hypothetical protein